MGCDSGSQCERLVPSKPTQYSTDEFLDFSYFSSICLAVAHNMKDCPEGWRSEIARANRAIHRAVGKYAPAIRLAQLRQPQPEALPRILSSSVQQQIHDALQLDQGTDQPGGSTVQVQQGVINATAAGELVSALAATAASDPLPQPETEPQPTGTCPRCRAGRGTVAVNHLCQCRQCRDQNYPCPFCALGAVPTLERSVKTEEGTCPW